MIRTLLSVIGVAALLCVSITCMAASQKRTCLVLSDGYVSEYAWSAYNLDGADVGYPTNHPGHVFTARGLLDYPGRFKRWLDGWNVKRIDLEQYQGPLVLDGVDLVILDEVRQKVCDPYETAIVEFVRRGGGLLVYAGAWGLGSCPKTKFCTETSISSYQHTPLGAILPVEIQTTPDLETLEKKEELSLAPSFCDEALAEGINTADWKVFGVHAVKPRGAVLSELDGRPLICQGSFGRGSIVVYTGDDLAWVGLGKWEEPTDSVVNKFSGTLWRRLSALAVGDKSFPRAVPDELTKSEKGAVFAHPDQPVSFHWGGGWRYGFNHPLTGLWRTDLISHSSMLLEWRVFDAPLDTGTSGQDPDAWMVDSEGKKMTGKPCYNNPVALKNMEKAMADKAGSDLSPGYGHMGDETWYDNCYCEYCKKAFREQFGYDLPGLKNDFSPDYLDKWIDYHLFKNRSIGRMYAGAVAAAHSRNSGLKMFASLPQVAGSCYGVDEHYTQSGLDLLWDHTYPSTMVCRTGFNASLMEETAQLQGRPYVPIYDLLQVFDYAAGVPAIPPAEYARGMVWQSIAHGVDGVGWFVYNYLLWNLPGTEAWDEIGRMGRDVLAPMTPTLYEMLNSPQPIGLLYSHSQEAVDGLRQRVSSEDYPWRFVSFHSTQEAYEVLKYSHVPFNVVSEYRLIEGSELPWKVIIIPHVEYLHHKTREALESFMAKGGIVYVGADSTLDLQGIRKLPVSFDTKVATFWPKGRKDEWNARRSRAFLISAFREKAAEMRSLFSGYADKGLVKIDDPEVVYNVREAGVAKYLFLINDHQINPVSSDIREKRAKLLPFSLVPMEFPEARAKISIRGPGFLYPLLTKSGPGIRLDAVKRKSLDVQFDGGDGKVFLILPDEITKVEFTCQPKRSEAGVDIRAHILSGSGEIKGSLPMRVDLECAGVRQTAYATAKNGVLSWTVPFLNEFPGGPIVVTVTDLASGKSDRRRT